MYTSHTNTFLTLLQVSVAKMITLEEQK